MRYFQQHFLFFILILQVVLLTACGGGASSGNTNAAASNTSVQSSSVTSSQASSSPKIPISCMVVNFHKDELVNYKLPIIYGLCDPDSKTVEIEVAGKIRSLPLNNGYFKGAIELNLGSNDIRLQTTDTTSHTTLNYVPLQNPKKVQMIYAVAKDDDGHFLAAKNEPNDLETAIKRVAFQGLMMQSATSEMFFKAVKQRFTYTLVEDAKGTPIVQVLRLPFTRTELYTKTGYELYDIIGNELTTIGQNTSYKNMVIMGFSDYIDGRPVAHTALGGGSLGVFGGSHLHTCPSSVDEIIPTFSNTTVMNSALFPDDSGDRHTYWANCATGMGASLHEIGHTFNHLAHTDNGIMGRGFDNFNRLFMITEPEVSYPITTNEEGGAMFESYTTGTFLNTEWFSMP